MGTRGNLILKMMRRSNAAILSFVMGIRLRPTAAVILGGFAGLSLTSNIIPSALSFAGIMDSFSARWDLGGYAVYSATVWAVGGWAAQKTGDKKLGAIILGSVGLASGLLFTGAGIGTETSTLLTGGGAALLYGAVGGMIIGDALRNPPTDDSAAPRIPGKTPKKEEVKLFRFFK
jgi:hypothetical protein